MLIVIAMGVTVRTENRVSVVSEKAGFSDYLEFPVRG